MAYIELLTDNVAGLCTYLIILLTLFLLAAKRFNKLIELSSPSSLTKIANIRGNEIVRLVGVPQPIKPLLAPYSRQTCIYYAYSIEQKERPYDINSGYIKPDWQVIGSAQRTSPFILSDDTGDVLIDPKNAQITLTTTSEGPLDGAHHFHAKHHLVKWMYRTFAHINDLWVTEHALLPSEVIYVSGFVDKEFVRSPLDSVRNIPILKVNNVLSRNKQSQDVPLIISMTEPASKLRTWEHWYKTSVVCSTATLVAIIIIVILATL